MATITTKQHPSADSAIAGAQELQAAFTERKQELTWLAEFLTDDELLASACFIDACGLSQNLNAYKEDRMCPGCLEQWAQEATIRSALELKRTRIAELSRIYECHDWMVGDVPLPPERVELVVRESDLIRRGLDSLCRFVLVLCGLGHQPIPDAAHLLGVSRHAVEAAYSRALRFLEIVECQEALETSDFAAA